MQEGAIGTGPAWKREGKQIDVSLGGSVSHLELDTRLQAIRRDARPEVYQGAAIGNWAALSFPFRANMAGLDEHVHELVVLGRQV